MARLIEGLLSALRRRSRAFAAGFGALSMLRHRAFETGRFDLGNMVQAVWSTAHGHPLRVTNLRGEQALRLGAHLDPVLVLFAPLWWLWPSPDLLLVVQAIALALGALPVYWLGRKHLGSRARRARLRARVPRLSGDDVARAERVPSRRARDARAALRVLVPRRGPARAVRGVRASLAAICRRTSPLVLAGYGVWYALARAGGAKGASIAVASVSWTRVAVALVIPHFRGGQTPFVGRYSEARAGGRPTIRGRCSASRSTTSACATCSTLVLPLAASACSRRSRSRRCRRSR